MLSRLILWRLGLLNKKNRHISLTETLKLNPNLLSYWEQNSVKCSHQEAVWRTWIRWSHLHIPRSRGTADSGTRRHLQGTDNIILVWPTSWTPAAGGLFVGEWVCVCVSVCPRSWPHIARHMMNGWLWNAIWFNLHLRDGTIHCKLCLLKLTMAVGNVVFRIIKGAF